VQARRVGHGGVFGARGAVVAELTGRDAVMDRLLAVARDELGVEVAFHAGPRLPDVPEGGAHLDMPVLRPDGSPAGILRFAAQSGHRLLTAQHDKAVRILSRFVTEQLHSWDRAYTLWEERTERIREILATEELEIVFQPVADLRTGQVLGVEALSRFPGSDEQSPDVWFADAADVGLSVELETLAVRSALPALQHLPADTYLSVNVSPLVAMSPELGSLLQDQPLDRLVLEITEHAQIDDYGALNDVLAPFRKQGLRVAVDDTGSGFASLRHILQMSPDVIKLDTTLTHGIDNDAVLRALAYSISSFASAIDAAVVAEGVETESELDALRFLHVACGQGFYLRRPGPLPASLELDTAVLIPSSPG
jgi:EAL domain-containing protein (putative c-di-GMP-specific phosphodiesterase class I)